MEIRSPAHRCAVATSNSAKYAPFGTLDNSSFCRAEIAHDLDVKPLFDTEIAMQRCLRRAVAVTSRDLRISKNDAQGEKAWTPVASGIPWLLAKYGERLANRR
jgi:hypothetical protein